MARLLGLIWLMLSFYHVGLSQKIEQHLSFRDLGSDTHFRFNYDNDYFATTDRNYTQGYSFELLAPALAKNPISKLLWRRKEDVVRYGMSLEHIGFTPKNIVSEAIQYGDRPFASSIFLKSYAIGVNPSNTSRFTSSLSLGILGQAAFGEEMQVGIHRATGNKIPGGWHNQIQNDVVINYEIAHEQRIYRWRDRFQINSDVNLRLGTTSTKAGIGVNSIVGLLPSQTQSSDKTRWKIYAYGRPFIDIVEYDATLQGGKFNRESTYTIPSRDIKRIVGHFHYGLIIQKGRMYFEYMRAMLSPEYQDGEAARYGGIRIGRSF